MVRINLINPRNLSDQHLIAEYNEILMLVEYIRKFPSLEKDIPKAYVLGKGHMKFFKDKLKYLKKRHEQLKKEMKRRGFAANKVLNLTGFERHLIKDFTPGMKEFKIIKKRIIDKINLKPGFYRYYKNKKSKKFFVELIKNG